MLMTGRRRNGPIQEFSTLEPVRMSGWNFPQNRLTDHRVDLTLYSLDRIIEGELDPVLTALRDKDLSERIAAGLGKI